MGEGVGGPTGLYHIYGKLTAEVADSTLFYKNRSTFAKQRHTMTSKIKTPLIGKYPNEIKEIKCKRWKFLRYS